ncbi:MULTISPECIES: nuclear transport factor 2 family protein [Cupriavidus]|uniref:SnoaL-like domain-containing protein n=1 Tax=Cupriavidus pinatubonensis (strain JMP 134 / LMG 1197) TaxID=264198 RepID=Q471D3_CUPPJ|nr:MULTISPECIES: nuclear transport factor 2 family protein [Cupriavidus]TPQ36990.1 hypothetical protein C2U69_17280 [Cupriavidus pinatubonensis]
MPSPKEVVQASYEAYRRRQIDTVMSLMAPQVDWKFVGPPAMRYAGPRGTLAEIREVFEQMMQDDVIEVFEAREFIEAGDDLVVLGFVKGTTVPEGKPFESDWAHVFTVRDGKITRWRGFYDTAARCV